MTSKRLLVPVLTTAPWPCVAAPVAANTVSLLRRGQLVLALVGLLTVAWMAHGETPRPTFPYYLDQNSAISGYRSGIVTSTGIVWDSTFAAWVRNSLNIASRNYSEIVFDFNQCRGGGMLDELVGLNLAPAAYTSAARWTGDSFDVYIPIGVGPFYGNTYSHPFTLSLIDGNTMLQAAKDGFSNDIYGPVLGSSDPESDAPEYKTNPQYKSSDKAGDSIVIGGNNSNNPTKNTNYLAVLFGGSPAIGSEDTEIGDLNSLAEQYKYLKGLDGGNTYNQGKNIFVLSSGDVAGMPQFSTIPSNAGVSASDLRNAWAGFIGDNATPTTQIFYSNFGHGTSQFDLVSYLSTSIPGGQIQQLNPYLFPLELSFLQSVQLTNQYFADQGVTSGTHLPFFEIQSPGLIDGLAVTLNGNALASMGAPSDIYGDGSAYAYDFQLSTAIINGLATSDNSVEFGWAGSSMQTFTTAGINLGDDLDGIANAQVPEPGVIWLLIVGPFLLRVSRCREQFPGELEPGTVC